MSDIVAAFDTANETIAVGIGRLNRCDRSIATLVSHEQAAFRASNTKLIDAIDGALAEAGVDRGDIACVVCGRGPGSFTGVRICLATAKGLALGLGVPLYGISTADAQAWHAWHQGMRGSLVVVNDAMRKEVYPVRYNLNDGGARRCSTDVVMKASLASDWMGSSHQYLLGDALAKYSDLFASCGTCISESLWHPTGSGLLLAVQAAWHDNIFDPDDIQKGNPGTVLPVYTRLSDAEEHERIRLARCEEKDLRSGVQGSAASAESDSDGQDLDCEALAKGNKESAQAGLSASSLGCVTSSSSIRYQPLDGMWVNEVARLEAQAMGSDAWNANQIADELPRADRTWWAAFDGVDKAQREVSMGDAQLVGYVGGWIVDGQLQILKIAVDPAYRRLGIARELLACVARDARDLGAHEATLEVRASNTGAHRLYESLGLVCIGVRPRYYSDREDARIYTGPLPIAEHDVAGMHLRINETSQHAQAYDTRSLIVALETSCDETAAAIVDAQGAIVADVVASQIDFHSRFGGVVPEIASRKHIEAIGGVLEECLDQARCALGRPDLSWHDMSAIAVTYAPGLVGALVVGLACAKGLAWACDKPLIGVNHLEGHIYANKIARPDIQPPMVVSLVSGGHTLLVHVRDWGDYVTLGSTLDDAVGEAFDKVAKAMDLGYPGGPLVSALATEGNPKAIHFPRALMHSGDLQFSLSGLKTSVMTYLQKEKQAGRVINKADVAASFQAAVVDVQIAKARMALEQTGAREFCLGGGVAANPALRAAYEVLCDSMGVRLTMPPLSACTDNAAMISLVALERYQKHQFFDLDCDVAAHASLDDPY